MIGFLVENYFGGARMGRIAGLPVVFADHDEAGGIEAERRHQQVELTGGLGGEVAGRIEGRRLEHGNHRTVGGLLGNSEFFERVVDKARVFFFFGEIFLDGGTQRGIVERRERALVAQRGELLGHRVRGEQPQQHLGVMRIDAAPIEGGGVQRSRRELAPDRHRVLPHQLAAREGRMTVAEPGVVFSPLAFSSQISQSTM